METLLFFYVIGFVIIYSIVEATHDYNVIKNDCGYNEYSKRWHWWGMVQNALAFFPVLILLYIFDPRVVAPMAVLIAFLFWQLHDSLIGWMLYRRPFYLSNKGLDRWLNDVFQGGDQFFVIRLMFIVVCTFIYFRTFINYA